MEADKLTKDQRACLFLCFAFLATILFKSAWITDDFFITLRSIQNFFDGRGLTWNAGERVQTYTHPLWMLLLLLSQAVTREFYFTTLVLSVLLTLAAVWIAVRKLAADAFSGLMIVIACVLSNSFIDFSTSGLENCLSHFLLAAFFWIYLQWDRHAGSVRDIFFLSLLASLILLSRMDLTLILLPALIHVFARPPDPRMLGAALAGSSPFLLWELFSLFYYGFPFPNTAYAKLNTSIPQGDLAIQGLWYVLSSVDRDPLTPVVILGGVVTAFCRRSLKFSAIGCGVLLYMAYVIRIGGDYMTGRFLSVPFFCALLVLAACPFPARIHWRAAALALITFVGFLPPASPVHSSADYGANLEYVLSDKSIVDERARYFHSTGLLHNFGFKGEFRAYPLKLPNLEALRARKMRTVTWGTIGYGPYIAGPDFHFVDYFALSDPLLSKLPVSITTWEIGHFFREIPDGYLESVASGKNRIQDRDLARYYDVLCLITRGDLFDGKRLKEIVRLNAGRYDHLLPKPPPLPSAKEMDLASASALLKTGALRSFAKEGLIIRLGKSSFAQKIRISVSANDDYTLVYMLNDRPVAERSVLADLSRKTRFNIYDLDVPEQARSSGFNAIWIVPMHGDEKYFIGGLDLNGRSVGAK